MANIYENPSYKANVGYSGFPMGQLSKFSSTVGELLPVYYDLLQPGDKVSIQTELKTRTMELESAAMCHLEENIDWFFVPLEQLYSPFGSWFYGINDLKSSNFSRNDISQYVPYFSTTTFHEGVMSTFKASDSDTAYVQDDFGKVNTSARLFEALGIDSYEVLAMTDYDSSALPLCPLYFCAYQKIYFDRYCLKDREEVTPFAWNLDKWYDVGVIPATYFAPMTKLHYRPWQKDFFTNTFVSPLMASGDVNTLGSDENYRVLEESFNQWLVDDLSFTTFMPDGHAAASNESAHIEGDFTYPSQATVSQLTAGFSSVAAFTSPTALRTSFALQKLLEVTRRAGKHVDAQQLAHFGVKLPTGISGEVTYIGSDKSQINIGDIIATAGTDSTPLGKIGGKGYGFGKGNKHSYTAPCHGILMGIYSAVPKADYTPGYDKLHLYLNSADYPRPEYDNLGMQPLFMYQGVFDASDSATNSSVLGWQYRWSELKCKPDVVKGALRYDLNYWTPQRAFDSNVLKSYLVDPNYLDDIMLVSYNPSSTTAAQIFTTDPLIHELYCDVKKASKMSTYGLEQL